MFVHESIHPPVVPHRPQSATSRRRRRYGTATVECAAMLPVLATLIVGMFEASRAIKVAEVLDDCARRGCRIAITPGKSNSDVTTVINNLMTDNGLPNATITISVKNQTTGTVTVADCNTAKGGDAVLVKVGIKVSDALYFWPNSYYLASNSIESQTLTMIKQYSSKDTLPLP